MARCRLPKKIASLSLVSRQYQLFALLFVTGLTLTFVPAATAQTRPSDVEMKEVMRLLLEREVPRSADGTTVTVLLDPNVRSGWVPETPGFTIRQLSYDEQKRVPEYYEFTWRSIKRDVLEVSLTKGNYCVKAGRRYEFRRKAERGRRKSLVMLNSTRGQAVVAMAAPLVQVQLILFVLKLRPGLRHWRRQLATYV